MSSKWWAIVWLYSRETCLDEFRLIGRPVPDYAKSSLYVARHQINTADGDLYLACEYLERVAASNSEEVVQAGELLKKVKSIIVVKAQTETETQKRATNEVPTNVPEAPMDIARDQEASGGPSMLGGLNT
jgi:anaphase-promoting complex subunit 8